MKTAVPAVPRAPTITARRSNPASPKPSNQLLERTVGIGKVRTEIHAEIDFDRLTTNDEIYNPDGQVIRSQQTVEEKEDNVNSDTNTAVSVSSNLPNQENQGAATSSSNRTT